ncbi:unnamed protein product [Protopolystoma xenopodis]|uniref:Uncharacterized protein n=1 Tax=Protopolystoma xenopodis TaxID=117903 RepID=A0A3S4ZVP1_9PLAT|nr:unnamed protein product [Protopolystoma xenopodis]
MMPVVGAQKQDWPVDCVSPNDANASSSSTGPMSRHNAAPDRLSHKHTVASVIKLGALARMMMPVVGGKESRSRSTHETSKTGRWIASARTTLMRRRLLAQ